MTKSIDERVKGFAKPATSVKHSGKIVKVIPRSEFTKLNASLAPKLEQNAWERIESFKEARDVIVKD